MIAAFWSAAFAVCHLYWALGGRLGVPSDAKPIGDRPVFLAYDIAAAVALGALAVLALTRRRRLQHVVGILLFVRGAVGLVQDAFGVSGMVVYDVWFAVAGVLFYATGRTASRSSLSTSPVAPARTPRRPSTIT